MTQLSGRVERALARIEKASRQAAHGARGEIIEQMLSLLDLPSRRVHTVATPGGAAAYVGRRTLDAARAYWIDPELRDSGSESLVEGLWTLLDSRFDSAFAHGVSEIEARAQIAASKAGRIESWQLAHRRCLELLKAATLSELNSGRTIASIESAIATSEFDLQPGLWAVASSDQQDEPWYRSLPPGDEEGLRDYARDRVRRHQVALEELLLSAVGMLACADLPDCQVAATLAEQLIELWARGVQVMWVCADEIILA